MRFRADWTPPVSPSLDVAPDGYVFVLNPANGARVRTPLHAGDANVILDAEGRIAGFEYDLPPDTDHTVSIEMIDLSGNRAKLEPVSVDATAPQLPTDLVVTRVGE